MGSYWPGCSLVVAGGVLVPVGLVFAAVAWKVSFVGLLARLFIVGGFVCIPAGGALLFLRALQQSAEANGTSNRAGATKSSE